MNGQTTGVLACALLLAGGTVATLGTGVFHPRTVRAAEAPGGISVRIAPLKDAGGAIGAGPDGKPMEERFTQALQKLLAEYAKGRFSTAGGKDSDFLVEGELSALQTTKNTPAGYLCTVRLTQTTRTGKRLIGQWAGTAKTIRDLTGNLTKDDRVSNLGLAGEFATRIAAVVADAAPDSPKPAVASATMTPDVYNALIKKAVADRRLTVDVMQEGMADQKPRNTLLPGEKYRLRVSPQDAGTVYLLQLVSGEGFTGRPKSPFAQNEALSASPGRSVMLPPNTPLVAPKTGVASWVVLLRRSDARSAAPAGAQLAPIMPQIVGSRAVGGVIVLPGEPAAQDAPQYGVADVPAQYGVPDSSPGAAVTVIGGALAGTPIASAGESPATPAKSLLDPEAERVLTMMKSDPAGTWIALEIKLPVVAGDKSGAAAPGASTPETRKPNGGGITIPGVGVIKKDP